MEKGKEEGFEARLARLREIVSRLEQEVALEEGVALYKEGLVLSRACAGQLERARNEVRLAAEGGLEDFPLEGSGGEGA